MMKSIAVSLTVLMLAGCETTQVSSSNPNANRNTTGGGAIQTLALTTVDFEFAAKKSVDKFLKSKRAQKPNGESWVTAMGEVVNDTSMRISTQSITDRMKEYMNDSGSFIFTGTFGTEKTAFARDSRQLNQSAMVDQRTVARNGTVIAPDFQMSGAIRQRTVVGADRKQQQIEYEFSFRVIDAKSGLEVFQTLTPIDKLGSNANFSW